MNALQAAHEAHKARRARMAAAAVQPIMRPVSIPLAIKPAPPPPVETPILELEGRAYAEAIISEMAAVGGFATKDIAPSQSERLDSLRMFAMWRAHKETPLTCAQIGQVFGGLENKAVLHAVKKTREHIASGRIPQAWLATVQYRKKKYVQHPLPRSEVLDSIIERVAKLSGWSFGEIVGRYGTPGLRRVRSFVYYQAAKSGIRVHHLGLMFGRHYSSINDGLRNTKRRLAAGEIPQAWLDAFSDRENAE